jgi:hypothetical protein
MEHITLLNIFFLLVGILLHSLIGYVKQRKIKKQFTFGRWFHENKITVLICFLVGFVSLYFVDFALDGLGVITEPDTLFYEAHAFISGFAPYDTFSKIFKVEIED